LPGRDVQANPQGQGPAPRLGASPPTGVPGLGPPALRRNPIDRCSDLLQQQRARL